ncbi:hypothetical protein ACFO9Q_19685 [Paenibacillus sp. GCM10023252]|uniref:hypothetical protein n=1 Tax=Paenibacillus sp. GCM10023252 TaxID=3252649 RepID=UPI00361AC98C
MLAIFIWLITTVIGCIILYGIIQAAINHSVIHSSSVEISTSNSKLQRQQEMLVREVEQLKDLHIEQNRLLRELVQLHQQKDLS